MTHQTDPAYRRTILCFLLSGCLAASAGAIEKVPPSPEGKALVDTFLSAMRTKDATARVKAVLPLVHKTLRSQDGKTLTADVLRYSFKKASQSVQAYASPARITEVHKGRTVQVGYKETAERGRRDKYFVAKREGVKGRPAPVHVFFPADGGAPRIIDFGSL